MEQSSEKRIAEHFAKIYSNILKQDELYMKSKCRSIQFWQMELQSLLDSEPFYLFKKKHQEWKLKVNETKVYLNSLYKCFDCTLEELQDFKNNLKKI